MWETCFHSPPYQKKSLQRVNTQLASMLLVTLALSNQITFTPTFCPMLMSHLTWHRATFGEVKYTLNAILPRLNPYVLLLPPVERAEPCAVSWGKTLQDCKRGNQEFWNSVCGGCGYYQAKRTESYVYPAPPPMVNPPSSGIIKYLSRRHIFRRWCVLASRVKTKADRQERRTRRERHKSGGAR